MKKYHNKAAYFSHADPVVQPVQSLFSFDILFVYFWVAIFSYRLYFPPCRYYFQSSTHTPFSFNYFWKKKLFRLGFHSYFMSISGKILGKINRTLDVCLYNCVQVYNNNTFVLWRSTS